MRIFISHSVEPKELVLVNIMAEELAQLKVTPTISDREWQTNEIPRRIRKQIEDANYMIGIITDKGHHFPWFNAEIIYSQKLSPKKPLLLVADASIQVDPSYESIIINRRNPLNTISEVSRKIKRLIQDKETQNLIAGILIGGVALLLLHLSREDQDVNSTCKKNL